MGSALRQSVGGEGRMGTAGRGVPSAKPRRAAKANEIEITENPISARNPGLGEEVEEEARRVLASPALGRLEVRFRVCPDEPEGMRFICEVEGPPPADPERESVQWRWWSPLMETAQDFRAALQEAVELRRERVSARQPSA